MTVNFKLPSLGREYESKNAGELHSQEAELTACLKKKATRYMFHVRIPLVTMIMRY
jgi:hypothetical protein